MAQHSPMRGESYGVIEELEITMNHVRAINEIERYRQAIIEWQEQRMWGPVWHATVTFESGPYAGRSKTIQGHSKDEMLTNARRYVDSLLDPPNSGIVVR
jgi:hypothetical protein